MLKLFDGQTIDSQVQREGRTERVRGKITCAGAANAYDPYGRIGNAGLPPLVEVDGKPLFQSPGVPLFPSFNRTLTTLFDAKVPALRR